MANGLCTALLARIDDQVERVEHLVSLVPPGELAWTPPIPRAFSISVLLGHVLDCLAGFCAVLYAANPQKLGRLLELKELPANQPMDPQRAARYLARYRDGIHEGFALLGDSDLERKVPTVFVPDGEPLMSLLLINYEHLASHKYQLFLYLRMLGREVGSRDLYRFSGA
jgi:uncharacterized damage-inducible protein DinB